MNTIHPIYTIRFRHDYYLNKSFRDLRPELSAETTRLFQRRGVSLCQTDIGKWQLFSFTDEKPFLPGDTIQLNFRIINQTIYWITKTDDRIVNEMIPVTIPIDDQSPSQEEIILDFETRQYYWEFILIPRVAGSESIPVLQEERNLISFNALEPYAVDRKASYRYKSKEKIACRESFDYELTLTENRFAGTRTLIRHVPFPVPGQFISPEKDCLTQIIYY